jgi:hypothetical protein
VRRLVSVFLACIPLSASTIELSVATCNGVSYQATDYAACGSPTTAGPFAAAYAGFAMAGEADGGDSSASFTADYALTVTGGSGSGFMDPDLLTYGDNWGGQAFASASASLEGSSGGCEASAAGGGLPNNMGSTCSPTSVAFVGGVPEILTLSLSATASGAENTSVEGETYYGQLEFFDSNGQPMSVTYTFAPVVEATPEPGTLLLTGLACVAFAALVGARGKVRVGPLFPVSGNVPVLGHIMAKLEARAD